MLEPFNPITVTPLRPFGPLPPWGASLVLTGGLLDRAGMVTVAFRLQGDLANLDLPRAPAATASVRGDQLWRRSCFECFLAATGEEGYCEVNFCPDGCWNVYRFPGYRRGMSEVADASLQLKIAGDLESLDLAARFRLPEEFCDRRPLQAALSAVLLHGDGARSYWALAHLGDEPDFHDRRSFLYRVPEFAEKGGPSMPRGVW